MRLDSRVHGWNDWPQGLIDGPSARQGCEIVAASPCAVLQGCEGLLGLAMIEVGIDGVVPWFCNNLGGRFVLPSSPLPFIKIELDFL